MLKVAKRKVVKMFREFLVYHNSSLEFRAKLITLLISANGEMIECEKQKLKEVAHKVYSGDPDRAELLIDTVIEYHVKIITNNGLNFEHLIQQVIKEVKEVKRFCNKIDIGLLKQFGDCIDEESEEDLLFHQRTIEFLQSLIDECRV